MKLSKNKYNNKKIIREDGQFDSKKEYTIWLKLKRMQDMGEISNLVRQQKFVLIPTQRDIQGNILERECSYIADFVYKNNRTSEIVVLDAKGIETEVFKIKKKLFLQKYNIIIKTI